MRTICAWCQAVMHEGDGEPPITHGICPECFAKEVGNLSKSGAHRLAIAIADAKQDRVILELPFIKVGNDLFCSACEHDILVARINTQWEVEVYRKGTDEVLAGPYKALNLDLCVYWAKGRCGLLPDQLEMLKNGCSNDMPGVQEDTGDTSGQS